MELTKSQLIDSIRALNRSADRAWLGLFTREELEQYYLHLLHAKAPRGEGAWSRPANNAAVVFRHAA